MTIIDQINEGLYEDARVYWQDGQGWTSRLWARLCGLGWSSMTTPAGFKRAQAHAIKPKRV